MPLQIFTAGKRTDANGVVVDFSESLLAKIAASYNPALHEAPLTIGHPKHDDPAYGWVSSLGTVGSQLMAEPKQVDPVFSESIDAGRYKKISASFYLPGSAHHPIPDSDVPYLRHVGFLGAMPPAVKGMAPIEFADGEEGVFFAEDDWIVADLANALGTMFQGIREYLIDEKDLETADRVLPDWKIESIRRMATQLTASAMEESEDAPGACLSPIYSEQPMSDPTLDAREQSIADRELALNRREAANFCDSLIQEGRAHVAGIRDKAIALLTTFPNADSVQFGEGDETATPKAMLEDILRAIPKTVEFAEVAPANKTPPAMDGKADTPELVKLAKKKQAEAFKTGSPIEYAEAVRMAAKELGIEEPK
jgi:hypothetical protein